MTDDAISPGARPVSLRSDRRVHPAARGQPRAVCAAARESPRRLHHPGQQAHPGSPRDAAPLAQGLPARLGSTRCCPRAAPIGVAHARCPRRWPMRSLSLKDEQPALSIPQLIRALRESGAAPASRAAASLDRAPAAQPRRAHAQDHRRAQHARTGAASPSPHAGELWMSDVMHGPSVAIPGRGRRKTYLIAFLDDATRVVPYCAFALSENTQAFLPVFKQALMRRGIRQRLYVDNGANYRSPAPRAGVRQARRRADPRPALSAPGQRARWSAGFAPCAPSCSAASAPADTDSLDSLNRRLWAWVEGEYHQSPHRGLDDQTPLDRWAMSADQVRLPGPQPRSGCPVPVRSQAPRPARPHRQLERHAVRSRCRAGRPDRHPALRPQRRRLRRGIEVWHDGTFVERATPLDAYANCFVRRNRPTQNIDADDPAGRPRAPAGLALRDLRARTNPMTRSRADVPRPFRLYPLPLRARTAAR